MKKIFEYCCIIQRFFLSLLYQNKIKMKTAEQIAQEIISIEVANSTSDYETWNGKFYTTKEGQTSIYVNDNKYDFTENYNMLPRDEKDYLHVSRFVELVEQLRQPVMEQWYENN